ncbi:MAG: T9SS type A sorting domain-containing protein [Candidatus Cloacimonetes bacterium]|nr:T9SS type A sorting domain-containing protein [Candidatus Cloacimonadota bacterium]
MFKYYSILVLLLLTVSIFSQTAVPPAGDGTEPNPYQIACLENLYWITVYQSNNETDGLYFVQTSDIDASETINWFDGEGWEPIGENYDFGGPLNKSGILPANERDFYSFQGHFDGQGHKIDGLYINRPEGWGVGLFASISYGATVRNLGLTNITVIGDEHVGGIAGQAAESGLIENCFVEGNISGGDFVGGLIGYNSGVEVTKCYTKGSVSGSSYVGGLVGYINWSQTNNLYTHAEVSGGIYVGGIAGMAWSTYMDLSYVTGAITCSEQYGGPIVGFVWECAPWNCYYNTETTGFPYAGFPYGRTTEEMTYPYADNVYINWDFENIWVEDVYMFHNDGYPYLSWQTFYFEFIPPASLSATPGDKIVTLNWHEPPDSLRTLLGYNVYRDDEQINEELLAVTEYLDTDVINEVTYRYYVTALYDEGESGPSNRVLATPSLSSSEPEIIPFRTELLGNYPNPFNPETRISFYLDKGEKVKLEVFNIGGQKITTLIDDRLEQGEHSVIWSPRTTRGGDLPSGVYLYRLQAGDYDRTRKMLYLK